MATSSSSLPIVDLSILSEPKPSLEALDSLSRDLSNVFSTTGFAYLINAPLSFSHKNVFGLAQNFFQMDRSTKMSLAKQTFLPSNSNTYRGYFPLQPGQQDNLKEGFEIGPAQVMVQIRQQRQKQRFDLSEPNVWPSEHPAFRTRLEWLHQELQSLSSTLLSLLAVSLGKPADYFAHYLVDSLSTLRLLHYPSSTSAGTEGVQLCCTPHTDSGILTLLHQDPTGGLEVLNSQGDWIPAPYVPESIVVNIGDLMSQISGGRFVATMHRVRASSSGDENGLGRLSVPFFFEPGEDCIIEGVAYGTHVRRKMGTWVEYDDQPKEKQVHENSVAVKVSA